MAFFGLLDFATILVVHVVVPMRLHACMHISTSGVRKVYHLCHLVLCKLWLIYVHLTVFHIAVVCCHGHGWSCLGGVHGGLLRLLEIHC